MTTAAVTRVAARQRGCCSVCGGHGGDVCRMCSEGACDMMRGEGVPIIAKNCDLGLYGMLVRQVFCGATDFAAILWPWLQKCYVQHSTTNVKLVGMRMEFLISGIRLPCLS